MRGLCAIDVAKDKTFVSLAGLRNRNINFIEESSVNVVSENDDILDFFKENFERINQKITEQEKKHSLKVKKIFVTLPQGLVSQRVVKEIFPLRDRKKITPRDIALAKKHVETISLEWNDFCIHHLILDYGVNGNNYKQPPLGIETQKIIMHSSLISVKEKLYKEMESILINTGRNFGGFVTSFMSTLFTPLTSIDEQRSVVVVDIGYDATKAIAYKDKQFFLDLDYDFGLREIIGNIKDKFSLPLDLAEDLFEKYASFNSVEHFKEISIRNNDSYINLNIKALNAFSADYVSKKIKNIAEDIKSKIGDSFIIFFIGRLSSKNGFDNFVKTSVDCDVGTSFFKVLSSSLGCLRYGVSNYLEKDYQQSESIFKNILKIYKEYF